MTDDRSPGELRRLAVHEAGHVTMASLVDRPVSFATVEPGDHFNAITFLGPLPPIDSRRIVGAPTFVQSLDRILQVAAEIAVLLAGPMTEAHERVRRGESGYIDTADEDAAKQLVDRYVRKPLDEQQADDLARAQREGLAPHDWELAQRVAHFLADECGAAFLAWIRREVEVVVRSSPFQHRVEAVAALLQRDGTVPGSVLEELFSEMSAGMPQGMVFAASTKEGP